MSNQGQLKIYVEFQDFKQEFEGKPDDVLRALIASLTEVYPTLSLVTKLTFQPDLVQLAESLVGFVEFTPEGLFVHAEEVAADEAIIISLVGSYVGYRLGKLGEDTNTADSIAKTCGKALKTISNQLAWIVEDGFIERVERGKYRITSIGIRWFEKIVDKFRQEGL